MSGHIEGVIVCAVDRSAGSGVDRDKGLISCDHGCEDAPEYGHLKLVVVGEDPLSHAAGDEIVHSDGTFGRSQ